jgi:uncharacterized protein YndB with AHSA1/START domain
MSFTNFSTGTSHTFGGRYLELVPHERIQYTDNACYLWWQESLTLLAELVEAEIPDQP